MGVTHLTTALLGNGNSDPSCGPVARTICTDRTSRLSQLDLDLFASKHVQTGLPRLMYLCNVFVAISQTMEEHKNQLWRKLGRPLQYVQGGRWGGDKGKESLECLCFDKIFFELNVGFKTTVLFLVSWVSCPKKIGGGRGISRVQMVSTSPCLQALSLSDTPSCF